MTPNTQARSGAKSGIKVPDLGGGRNSKKEGIFINRLYAGAFKINCPGTLSTVVGTGLLSNEKPEIINPPNTLKQKVGIGGSGAVDLEALERAEQVILDMTDNYLEWVAEDLKKIEAAYQKLADASGDRKKEMDAIFQISHDIKGQGGSFGYDLMTAIGNELCRLIERIDKVGLNEVQAVKIHIDSMKLIIAQDMKGNGGKPGQKILASLHQVCEKLVS